MRKKAAPDNEWENPASACISAWASMRNFGLGQLKTHNKPNEIIAIPQLLDMLSLDGATAAIDASACQPRIAEKIVDKGANYVLAVKANRKKPHGDIKMVFDLIDSGAYPAATDKLATIEKNHGRIEMRKYEGCHEARLLVDRYTWAKLMAFARATSTRVTSKGAATAVKYFITSRVATPEFLAGAVRGHWSIENRLHWVLDMALREDESRARVKNLAANLATLKHLSFNMLKKLNIKQSVRVRRKMAGWEDKFMLSALKAQVVE